MSCWNGCPGCPDCVDDRDVTPSKRAKKTTKSKARAKKKFDEREAKRAAKAAAGEGIKFGVPAAFANETFVEVNLPSSPAPSSAVAKLLDKALKVFALVKKKPRDIQVEAIRRCIEAYENGVDYVVLEAPPGCGKSLIGVALANAYGPRSYFTTLTAQLQEQYMTEFAAPMNMRVLKGRGKYECKRAGESCLIGKELFGGEDACYGPPDPLAKDPPMPHDSAACPYLFGKQTAFNSTFMMSNYHSFLSNIGQAAMYDTSENDSETEELEGEQLLNAVEERTKKSASAVKRPFMVLDEAHVIESFLLDQTGVSVNLRKLGVKTDPLPATEDSLEPYLTWMKNALPNLRTREKVLTDAQEKEEMRSLIRRIGFVLAKVEKAKAANASIDYVIERGRENDGTLRPDWFAVKPLRVHEYGHWLWGHGKKCLFMSATVLDAGQLCTNIGLDLAKGDFVQMGSVFPVANRPIKVVPLDMRKSNREFGWARAAQLVDGLMNHHQREKGLLLCPSNEMLKFISDNVSKSNRMRLIFAYGRDREAKYREHVLSRGPTVLAASGYWEGADLHGDLSRFQIIPAAPRPMWHGQIKARAKVDPAWYRWLTFTKLIQGLGRSNRCFDYDTEILTTMGWKSGTELQPGDTVYGVPKSAFEKNARPFRCGRLPVVENKVLDVNRPELPEQTVNIKTNAVDAVVTPDHRMLAQVKTFKVMTGTTNRNGKTYVQKWLYIRKTKGLTVIPARDLPARFNLPCGGWAIDRPQTKLDDAWFWLMGFIIGDGHLSRTKNTVTIYQSLADSQASQRKKLVEILAHLKLNFGYYEGKEAGSCFGYERNGPVAMWVFSGKDASHIRDVFAFGQRRRYSKKRSFRHKQHQSYAHGEKATVDGWKNPEKRIPRWALENADPSRLLSLLEGMMESDGSSRGPSRRSPLHTNGSYWTSDRILADQLQELLVLCGFRSSITVHRSANDLRKEQLCVNFVNPATSDVTRAANISPGPVTKVWCPTTELGSVIVRRNCKTFIAGNSESDESVTYIFDKEFMEEMNRKVSMVPPWVKEAVSLVGQSSGQEEAV